MTANTAAVKKSIEKLVVFLNLHQNLCNGHMVDYFFKSLYQTCLSESLRSEIELCGFKESIDVIFSTETNKKMPHLMNFIETCKSFSLYHNTEVTLNRSEFFNLMGQHDTEGIKLNAFAKSKKAHEVEMMSVVANAVNNVCQTSHLVDIGDGKGYLSSMVSFQYQIPVLGVDGSVINTGNSIKRATRLSKRWKSVTNQETDAYSLGKNYKQVTQLVTENTDFCKLVSDVFLEEPKGIGLIGLHTCGNLGPTSLRIFNSNPKISSICNVSCCYHLLNENYLASDALGTIMSEESGFPMSNYLKSVNFNLLRTARMLAAQSIDRILDKKEMPNKSIFYRAILECVLQDNFQTTGNVGRFRKEPIDFVDYAKESFKRLNLPSSLSDEELLQKVALFEGKFSQLMLFNLLRCFLSPVIEALILLDRVLYLKEQSNCDVYLVKLFDPVISPRCYGLIAIK